MTRNFFGLIPTVLFNCVIIVGGFSASSPVTLLRDAAVVNRRGSTASRLFLRTNVEVPLFDLLDVESDYAKNIIMPLPSSHLSAELATPFLYGMQLERPIDKMMLEEASTIHCLS